MFVWLCQDVSSSLYLWWFTLIRYVLCCRVNDVQDRKKICHDYFDLLFLVRKLFFKMVNKRSFSLKCSCKSYLNICNKQPKPLHWTQQMNSEMKKKILSFAYLMLLCLLKCTQKSCYDIIRIYFKLCEGEHIFSNIDI